MPTFSNENKSFRFEFRLIGHPTNFFPIFQIKMTKTIYIILLITTIILILWSTGCRPVYQQMYVNGVKVGEPTKFVPRDTMYRVFKMYRR